MVTSREYQGICCIQVESTNSDMEDAGISGLQETCLHIMKKLPGGSGIATWSRQIAISRLRSMLCWKRFFMQSPTGYELN